jgi:uroporphyrinogen decarboxylase
MNSLERVRCAARREVVPDIIPVAPYMGNHGARVAGVPIGEYCRSGERMAQAQIAAWEAYRQDVVVAQSDNYYIAEGFGVQVDHYADSTPTLAKPAIDNLHEVYGLSVPDPHTDGRMPVYLKAIRLLAAHFGGEVAVRAPGTGPFSLASHILGTERFLMALAEVQSEPGGEGERALRHLMDLATEALIRFSEACLGAGADMVQAGDSLASIDMISPAMYRQWAWPYEQRFFTSINPVAQRQGAMSLLHICGNMTPVLEDMAASCAHILELDSKVDLEAASQKVGARVCLMGNLNPVTLLWQGSPEEVEQNAAELVSRLGSRGGFILGSGCEVPVAAPQENLRAMIRGARRPTSQCRW